uniref:Uncharacterized protein n=1 Tax=Arundo donax TaxID=35708 RepID=A0A0A9HF34_ARUDO
MNSVFYVALTMGNYEATVGVLLLRRNLFDASSLAGSYFLYIGRINSYKLHNSMYTKLTGSMVLEFKGFPLVAGIEAQDILSVNC